MAGARAGRRRPRSFLLLGAEFVGITQVLVYIGAIVVLFLFGIMLTRAPTRASTTTSTTSASWHRRSLVALLLLGVIELHADRRASATIKVGDA